jgi:3-phenylpropionate/trans-cinnamate dioxygenase ferredoxin subunit
MTDWVRVTEASRCTPDTLVAVEAGGERIVLANVEGDIYALEDRCSHEDFPLSDGDLSGSHLTCLHHGASFDACSGRATGLPAIRPVRTYPVEVRDGDVFVQVG